MAPHRKVVKKAAKKNPLKKHFKGAGRKVMASMKRRYGKTAGKRIFYSTENKLGIMNNPSAAFVAGQRYLKAKLKTAKGSFNSEPGALQYLKKMGYEGTRSLAPPYTERTRERVAIANALYKEFLDGVDQAWNEHITKQHDNPDETDLMIESTPLAESFCVERLDIHTQETKPIATDLTASEAKTVASALAQNHGEGAFFNVEPERGVVESATANPSPKSPNFGRIYGSASHPSFITNRGVPVWMWRKGQRVRFYTESGKQVRPEQPNVAPAVAAALAWGWTDVIGARWKANPQRRSNPDSQIESERLYKTFHGADPKFVTDVRTELFSHDSYAKLGDLISFTVIGDDGREYDAATPNPDIASKEDVVSLAASPSGRQLYFIGGDQEINPASFGIKGHAAHKDLICLGRLKAMCYRAAKEMHDFELIDYTHKSGENLSPSGKRYLSKDALPYLNYDALNKQLSVAGGAYFITGRGIEN